jgi:hypothetical protein
MGFCGSSLLMGSADGPFVADGELPASACAAPGKHGASIDGLHTRTETVRLGALAIIGLKRSLRHCLGYLRYSRRWSGRVRLGAGIVLE